MGPAVRSRRAAPKQRAGAAVTEVVEKSTKSLKDNKSADGLSPLANVGRLIGIAGVVDEMKRVYRLRCREQISGKTMNENMFALRCLRDALETMVWQETQERVLALEERLTGNGAIASDQITYRSH